MKELIEALGPWPTLQGVALGVIITGIATWAIFKGLQGRGREPQLEEARSRWEMREWLRHIHDNSFQMVALLERSNDLLAQLLAAINRGNDNRWNGRQ